MHKYFLVIFWLIYYSFLWGASHYLDKNANGLNNGTSWTNAWETFSSINWNTIGAGDTLFISGGIDSTVYNENLTIGKSGNANNLIVMRPGLTTGHNGRVIIAGSSSGNNITVQDKKYVRLEKLEITMARGTTQGIYIKGTGIGAVNVVYIDSCSIICRAGNYDTWCMRIDGWNTPKSVTWGDSIFVRYGYFENTRSTPIEVQTDAIIFQCVQNIFIIDNRILVKNDWPNTSSIAHNDCLSADNECGSLTIANNILINTQTNNYQSQVCIFGGLSGTFRFYNNVVSSPFFKNTGNYWPQTFTIYPSSASCDYYIYSNTFQTGANNYLLRFQGTLVTPNVRLKNNIFDARQSPSSNNVRIFFYNDVGSAMSPTYSYIDGNLYGELVDYSNKLVAGKTMVQLIAAGAETSGNGNNRWNVDPKFNNEMNYDYSLQSTSPAIDVGVTLDPPYNSDLLGIPRPQGSNFDIGAYEVIDNSSGNYININEGWNYISIPKLASNMTSDYLLPTRISPVYEFNGTGYHEVNTLQNGKGYIVKFSYPQYIFVGGDAVSLPIQVFTGWNLIGPFDEDIQVSQISSVPSGIINSSFLEYTVNGFLDANILQVGKGYWVKVTSDGVINLNNGSIAKDGEDEPIAKVEQDWGKIKITDIEGTSITLYATEEEIESDFYELPPAPPTGIFDARYSSGKLVEALSSEKIILISSDKYPITIKSEGISIRIKDRIDGKMLDEELRNGEEIRITNNKITSIEVTGTIEGKFPVTFELNQNYPNPFNPSTTIKFAVPKETNVNLSIYNVLGELISTLVNEEMKPGYYEHQFKASNLASGVYLYRFQAGSFVETKKMILLR